MKTLLFLLCVFCSLAVYSQEENQKTQSVSELFKIGEKTYKNGKTAIEPFSGHLRGFNYGFINFANIPDEYKAIDLKGKNSFSMQFNIIKYNIGLNKRQNIGLVTGLGLEYQRLKFENDEFTLIKKDGLSVPFETMAKYPEADNIKRSCFKNLYLTLPVLFEVQFPASQMKANRVYVSGGVMGGVRMHSKTKVIYKDSDGDKHKRKNNGNYNMVPFKLDAIARIGFSRLNVWGSYTITNMFKNQTDLNVYTIGLGVMF